MSEKKSGPAGPIAMIAFHSALRRDLWRARLVLQGSGRSRSRERRLGRHLLWLADQLRWHHEGEDVELWPMLAQRDPRLRDLLDEMEREHHAIDEPLAAFESAARGLVTGWGGAHHTLDALRDLEAPLLEHLRHEEDDLLPHVTRLMSHQEWDDFQQRGWISGSTATQAVRFITWMIDRSDWTAEEARRLGVPGPAYRLVLRPLSAALSAFSSQPWRGTEAAGIGPLAAREYGGASR